MRSDTAQPAHESHSSTGASEPQLNRRIRDTAQPAHQSHSSTGASEPQLNRRIREVEEEARRRRSGKDRRDGRKGACVQRRRGTRRPRAVHTAPGSAHGVGLCPVTRVTCQHRRIRMQAAVL
eukprot:3775193-Rhodomonas_salina.1